MGWWKIESIETGAIDMKHRSKDLKNTNLANAIPGQDSPDNLYNGDEPADIMGDAIKKINSAYIKAWKRPANKDELKAILNFCMGAIYK